MPTRFQSPSRGGRLRWRIAGQPTVQRSLVSVPFTRGTPPLVGEFGRAAAGLTSVSVPFTRGTPSLALASSRGTCSVPVSVPFTRGTPPLACGLRLEHGQSPAFQSPSRGGRLRWPGIARQALRRQHRFSPLHEGDTFVGVACQNCSRESYHVSVPFTRGTPSLACRLRRMRCSIVRFSPLHEGDASVGAPGAATRRRLTACFSPLHEGDAFVGFTLRF